jgi:DNA-binding IclR family transcriptional regulator
MKTFTDEHGELRISELVARRGLARSTVHRLASALVEAGMLEHDEQTGKYRLGIVLFELGSLVRRSGAPGEERRNHLKELQHARPIRCAVRQLLPIQDFRFDLASGELGPEDHRDD